MSIHRASAVGFARSAAAYERGRPGYPEEAVDRLVAALPGRQVVDLAAGTGKLTRALTARGLDVVAVEPVAEMRAAISAPARAVAGTAEAIPLPDGAVDAVTVAQAIHWFDGPRALAEIHRVLRPGGVLALIWNRRQIADPIHQEIEALLERHRGDTPAERLEYWRPALDETTLFGALREEQFDNEQLVDANLLADRIGSISSLHACSGSRSWPPGPSRVALGSAGRSTGEQHRCRTARRAAHVLGPEDPCSVAPEVRISPLRYHDASSCRWRGT